MNKAISYGNKALEFINLRLADPEYRGSWSSQHNRYTMKQVLILLSKLNNYAPNQKLMQIRDTDISKRPENTKEEHTYARFCNARKR